MCSELKQLYVAITRTRQRLWICENDEDISKPMLDYWKSLFLVQVRKLDDSLAQAMQKASIPEEWKVQGIKLFWEKNFEMATMCFEKAGEETWEKRAKASGLRAAAYSLKDSNPSEAHTMLREAAELFDSIGRADSAAECFCDLGEYERAGRIYLDKCGVSGLRKAGECFCLAGIYKTAAEVFSKGGFFNDCLSACSRGGLVDLGLQYIESWKQDASWNSLITTKLPEIERHAQEYLQKCASDCHRKNDKGMMMKFVLAFDTIESKREFLKKLDCFDEILVLEEESGNFNEAIDIVRRLGDVPREVDLLVKAGHFENASSLAVCYVLSKSLWLPKSFLNKDDLLAKAMSSARIISEKFYKTICIEAKLLSYEQLTASDLIQCYAASKKCETVVGEVFSIRKLLDVHVKSTSAAFEWEIEVGFPPSLLEKRIFGNRLSCSTLFHVWNLWKLKNFEILECLNSFGEIDFSYCDGAVRFCFDYFGVRLQSGSSGKVSLLFPNASWCKNVDDRFMLRSGKSVILETRHFAPAARKQWLQELHVTGFVTLEALKSLYALSEKKSVAKDIRSLCLTYIFDIAKFLMDSKTFDLKKNDPWKLQDYFNLSSSYFEYALPLDPRESLSDAMINLRETELSKNLLGGIVSFYLSNSKSGLSYGQMGRVAMILMGSGVPNQEVCSVIAEGFSKSTSFWKPFIENFAKGSNSPATSNELLEALDESYNANWQMRDYISPQCFIYLVERLLILAPRPRGYFFCSKSSFVEYLFSLNSDANPSSVLEPKITPEGGRIASCVFKWVQQFLHDGKAMSVWIKNSSINCKYYFPVMLLRLIMILCLLCVDFDWEFVSVTRFLNLQHIRSQLPREFCNALCSGRRNERASVIGLVAKAFKSIGDPLTIVCISKNCPKHLCPNDSTSVDLRTLENREQALRALFHRKAAMVEEDQVGINVDEIECTLKFEPEEDAKKDSGSTEEESTVADQKMDTELKLDTNVGSKNWEGDTVDNPELDADLVVEEGEGEIKEESNEAGLEEKSRNGCKGESNKSNNNNGSKQNNNKKKKKGGKGGKGGKKKK